MASIVISRAIAQLESSVMLCQAHVCAQKAGREDAVIVFVPQERMARNVCTDVSVLVWPAVIRSAVNVIAPQEGLETGVKRCVRKEHSVKTVNVVVPVIRVVDVIRLQVCAFVREGRPVTNVTKCVHVTYTA